MAVGQRLSSLGNTSSGTVLLTSGAVSGAVSQAQTFANGIAAPSWKPLSDSTNAINITNASGTSILKVDSVNRLVGIGMSPSYALDVAGSIRASGAIIGKHFNNLADAYAIWHFDGPTPYETDYTGVVNDHMGRVPSMNTNPLFVRGKFGKAYEAAEATTNLCTNPSFEVDTTGWAHLGNGTISRVSGGVYGQYCLKSASGGGDSYTQAAFQNVSCSGTSKYTCSCFVKNVDVPTTGSVQLIVYWMGGANSPAYSTQTVGSVSDASEWRRFSETFTPDYTDRTSFHAYIRFTGVTADGQSFLVDAFQIEEKGYCTPYCDGSLGSGRAWTGTPHASTSTRSNAILQFSTPSFDSAAGTIMAWVLPSISHTYAPSATKYCVIAECNYGSDGLLLSVSYTQAYSGARLLFYTGGQSAQYNVGSLFSNHAWHHVVATWNGNSRTIYLDGAMIASSSAGNPCQFGTDVFSIGSWNSTWIFNGAIDDVVLLPRALSADEIRAVYESGAPAIVESNAFTLRNAAPSPLLVDSDGLWLRDSSGNAVLGAYSGSATKSWGGKTLNPADVLIGNSSRGGYIQWTNSTGALDLYPTSVTVGPATPDTKLYFCEQSSDTSTVRNLVTLNHRSSGTPAAGFGAGLIFRLKSSTTNDQQAGRIVSTWNTATHASRSADLILYASDYGGERELIRGRATGTAAALGFYGVTPVTRATTGIGSATFVANTGTTVNDASTFDGYTIKQVVKALRDIGILT